MDLQSLSASLSECKHQYSSLGMYLNVDYQRLQAIMEFERHMPEFWDTVEFLCFEALLQDYMNNRSPDAEKLCDAVGALGKKDHSAKLREKYTSKN